MVSYTINNKSNNKECQLTILFLMFVTYVKLIIFKLDLKMNAFSY